MSCCSSVHHLLGDLVAGVRPHVDDLVVAFAFGDDAALELLLNLLHFLFGLAKICSLLSGVRRSSVEKDRPLRVDSRKPVSFMRSSSSMVSRRPRNW